MMEKFAKAARRALEASEKKSDSAGGEDQLASFLKHGMGASHEKK